MKGKLIKFFCSFSPRTYHRGQKSLRAEGLNTVACSSPAWSNQGEVALLVSPPYSYLNLCTHLEVWQMEKNPITVIHTHSCVSLPTSVYLQTACTKHMFLAEGLGPGLGNSISVMIILVSVWWLRWRVGLRKPLWLSDWPLFLMKPCLGRVLRFVEYFWKADALLNLKVGRDTLEEKLLLHHLTYTQWFFHAQTKDARGYC